MCVKPESFVLEKVKVDLSPISGLLNSLSSSLKAIKEGLEEEKKNYLKKEPVHKLDTSFRNIGSGK